MEEYERLIAMIAVATMAQGIPTAAIRKTGDAIKGLELVIRERLYVIFAYRNFKNWS